MLLRDNMKSTYIRVRSGIYVTNSYYIFDGQGHVLIIDPACSFNKSEQILNGQIPTHIILTHGHFDHSYDCDLFVKKYDTKIYVHEEELVYLSDSRYSAPDGIPFGYIDKIFKADSTFQDRDEIKFGNDIFTVVHTPGHTLGSCCFYADNVLFSGDTLFKNSIGRTDFPYGCDENSMTSSLKKLSDIIADDTVINPGHGFQTNMSDEKNNNPFLKMII